MNISLGLKFKIKELLNGSDNNGHFPCSMSCKLQQYFFDTFCATEYRWHIGILTYAVESLQRNWLQSVTQSADLQTYRVL